MTFSIIVPVYNVERYLAKCLESILNQSYKDFEIIVVNDGSPDNSQSIIDDYARKYPDKIKSYIKENGGLSDARNFGIARANGTYLMFVDSDDYLAPNALEGIYSVINHGNLDVIGFNLVTVNKDGKRISSLTRPSIMNVSGEEAIIALVEHKDYFEPACGFVYSRQYWCKNNFSFFKGIYHEDFALMPLVILKANKVSCIDLDAYYYVDTDGSITRTKSEDRERRLAFDLLKGYDFLLEQYKYCLLKNNYSGKLYLAYAANSVIYRLENLRGSLKSQFRKELRSRKVVKYIIDDTFKRKIRKLLIRFKNRI